MLNFMFNRKFVQQKRDDFRSRYLFRGSMFAHASPHWVNTFVDTGISLTLWDRKRKIGGMAHFKWPRWDGTTEASAFYGNIAIRALIEKMLRMGSVRSDLEAKVFGGAKFIGDPMEARDLGKRNIDLVLEALKVERICIVRQDVGGPLGRQLVFNTSEGVVLVKKIEHITGEALEFSPH